MDRIRCYILFLCLTAFARAQFDSFVDIDPDVIVDDETFNKKFSILESRIKLISEEALKMIYSSVTDVMGSLNISRTCFQDGTKVLLGLRKLNTWAIKFLDATTKSADGIFNFQRPSLGSYDECVNNIVLHSRPGKLKGQVMLQGKYCNVHFRTFLQRNKTATLLTGQTTLDLNYKTESIIYEIRNMASMMYFSSVRMGLCLPSGCSTADANSILRLVSENLGVSLKATACMMKEETEYTPIMIAVMTIYSFTGLLLLLGTVIDIYSHYFKKEYKSILIQILTAFSFVSNFKNFTNAPLSTSTSCLNGMRFLSMSWIVLAHTYMYQFIIHQTVPRNVVNYTKDLAFQAIQNGFFAVDTFFFISGFLTCYVTMKRVKIDKMPFSLTFYILHRIWRILPAYAFIIGFEFLKPLIGSGPLFHEVFLHDQEYCKKNWWTNLLFINNFYRNKTICIPQSWFIALDTQLYILALIILLPFLKWPKIGVFISCLAIVAAMAVTGIVCFMHKTVGIFTLYGSLKDLNTWHHYHNMGLHLHTAAFIIGLLLGYLLATRSDFKVPKVVQLLGWTLSTAVFLSILYGVQKWNAGVRPTELEIITYSAFSRAGWALCIAWMTFCCITGRGGFINYILSWHLWVPLSRLSYIAYLVHVTVTLAYNGSLRTIPPFQHYIIVWIFLGHLLTTYAVAFVGYVLVESPFSSLERILFFSKKRDVLSPKESAHVQDDLEKNGGKEQNNFNDMMNNVPMTDKNLIINGHGKNPRNDEEKNTHM